MMADKPRYPTEDERAIHNEYEQDVTADPPAGLKEATYYVEWLETPDSEREIRLKLYFSGYDATPAVEWAAEHGYVVRDVSVLQDDAEIWIDLAREDQVKRLSNTPEDYIA